MPIFAAMLLGAAAATSGATDFGVRSIGVAQSAALPRVEGRRLLTISPALGRGTLSGAVAVAAQWGRVTSTYRSVEHNRRVGGMRNSYHLSGRAVDVARRPGVSHWQIDAALRRAGFHLLESLDEGDHSHFAFGWGGAPRPVLASAAVSSATSAVTGTSADGTRWRVVYAPR